MYNYDQEKKGLYTEEGQRTFLQIRDRVHSLLDTAGAVRLQEAISKSSGDSFLMLACIDRLVELGEIREVAGEGSLSQFKVFVKAHA